VQAAFDVAEQHGHRFDALFVGEIFQTLFLNLVRGNAFEALFLGL
jgi:hypothetical protein